MSAAPCALDRLGYTPLKRLENAPVSGTPLRHCGIWQS